MTGPVRSGSALARVEDCLDRIERLEPILHAFITVTAEAARDEARQADAAQARGESFGPLHGMPVAIKDCIDVAGIRCTHGSSFFADNVPVRDAVVIQRLRSAGAIIVGKANMHEFAYGGTTQNAFYGDCRNPWDTGRIPGGSSGGSAVAVAAGLAEAALGSDTGSSIRMPAALTGTTGLRPTMGSVSGVGVLSVSPPHDIVGSIARDAADAARLQSVIMDPQAAARHGPAPSMLVERLGQDIAGLRIAIPDDFFFTEADPSIAQAVLEAAKVLERLGARLVTASLPGAAEAQANLSAVLFANAANFHRERLATHPEGFSEGVRARLQLGLDMRAIDYARSLRWLEAWQIRCREFFTEAANLVITPTTPITAPSLGDDGDLIAQTAQVSRFCWGWPAAGLPAISLPCGFSDSLPIGLQIAGGRWQDWRLLNVAHRYQQHTDWHMRTPALA